MRRPSTDERATREAGRTLIARELVYGWRGMHTFGKNCPVAHQKVNRRSDLFVRDTAGRVIEPKTFTRSRDPEIAA